MSDQADKAEMQTAHERESSEHAARVAKVKELEKRGLSAWPAARVADSTTKQVLDQFKDDADSPEYSLVGRLMTVRLHGKTAFVHLQDEQGALQLYIRKDIVGDESFDLFKECVDRGDIVWASGTAFRTKMGEVTLKISEFTLQSKCIQPLPEKFHGLSDVEARYRQRYLDLISNPESKDKFLRRIKIVRTLRKFLDDAGYLEVETPMLHPIAGGAAARPFKTFHNALGSDFYLRIAPELYLKRLVVGGFDRVFELNRSFRNEGVSTKHNPEFTMLEFYTAHQDYNFAMDLTEELLRAAAQSSCGQLQVPFDGNTIDFAKPFERLTMVQAIVKHGGLKLEDIEHDAIDAVISRLGIRIQNGADTYGHKIMMLFEEVAEKHLMQPTYIIDFPIEVSPLAKRDANNPTIAARFELYIAGMEVSNGFNELNDPFDQAQRFEDQLVAHRAGDDEAHQYDADYIKALEYGLPPTVGVGIGIDRLAMLLTDTTSIKDVILFPTLKKKAE
ncbi:lysine--tRNA ligase [bacterium]|jgi:lysyl-tRNA synthetase, class II|nr:lysine--tRNA ligase [bacterium]MBT4577829.1 lysine--tRNA ligase [bacterium]MBT5345469.1 lysine--tRNA ligase [bacterium]MBT6131163.1 lysine--tRNA ligase [bacterium]MBT6528571.1 lysine--tRNA ligase [bacterium]